MRTVFIYALCEPGTRTVRYIGKTVQNPHARFRSHITGSSKQKNYLGNWLRGILARGEVPNMVVLRGVPEAEGSAVEIKYIRIARESLGMRLVNGTDGGEGNTNPSLETRARMSAAGKRRPRPPRSPETQAKLSGENAPFLGHHHSPEHRARMSALNRGEKNPMFGKTTAWLGQHHTPEACARISAGLKGEKHFFFGKHHTAEHCAEVSKKLKGRPKSPETRANMRAAWAKRKAEGR